MSDTGTLKITRQVTQDVEDSITWEIKVKEQLGMIVFNKDLDTSLFFDADGRFWKPNCDIEDGRMVNVLSPDRVWHKTINNRAIYPFVIKKQHHNRSSYLHTHHFVDAIQIDIRSNIKGFLIYADENLMSVMQDNYADEIGIDLEELEVA